jgi:hypothetical protein
MVGYAGSKPSYTQVKRPESVSSRTREHKSAALARLERGRVGRASPKKTKDNREPEDDETCFPSSSLRFIQRIVIDPRYSPGL